MRSTYIVYMVGRVIYIVVAESEEHARQLAGGGLSVERVSTEQVGVVEIAMY